MYFFTYRHKNSIFSQYDIVPASLSLVIYVEDRGIVIVLVNKSCVLCFDRDDERLTPGGRVACHRDELAARLSISNLELTDTGVYTCVARCVSGVTRCSTELSVFDAKLAKDSYLLQPPIFVRGLVPPERTVVEGEPVELTVKLEGNNNDVHLVWLCTMCTRG